MEFHKAPDSFALPTLYGLQAIVLVLVGLFLGFMVLRLIRKRLRAGVVGMRDCRWRKDRKAPPRTGFTAWRCRACGIDAFSSDGKPPKECKRGLKTSL